MANKTKQEIDEAVEQFLINQSEYNSTHNTDIVWFKLEKYFRETAESIIKQKSKGHFVKYLSDKVDMVVDKLVERYLENPDYHFNLPQTLVYWAVISVVYSNTSKSLDAEERMKATIKEDLFDCMYRNGEII